MKKEIIFASLVFVLFISGCAGKYAAVELEEEYCAKIGSGESMTLTEAKEIAVTGECDDRLKESYMCNENTGTWWIDLDIEKEGCYPACVVNVATKETEINWRCTGLIVE